MQLLLVILAICSASFYLVWQFYKRFFKKESNCDSCAFGESTKGI